MVQVLTAFAELFCEGMIVGQGFNELEINGSHVKVGETDADFLDDLAELVFQPECLLIEFEGLVGILDEDGDVIELLLHAFLRLRGRW